MNRRMDRERDGSGTLYSADIPGLEGNQAACFPRDHMARRQLRYWPAALPVSLLYNILPTQCTLTSLQGLLGTTFAT